MEIWKVKKAPAFLSREAKAFWRDLQSRHQIDDPARLTLLTKAAEAMDRATAARKVIAAEGVIKVDRFGQSVVHPACRVIDSAESSLRASIKALGLDREAPAPAEDEFSQLEKR